MPTYEYACRDCGEHLEVVQSFKDDALTTCPACSGSLRKVFSAAGIIFKGSGWHVKDYASSGRPSGSSDSGGAGGDSNDASSGSDTTSGDATTDTSTTKKADTSTTEGTKGSKASGSSTSASSGTTAQKKSA